VATVVASGSRNRRAGELLAQGVPAEEIANALGQSAEAVDSVPLLANVAREARLPTPALDSLAALVEGRIEPERWAETVADPTRSTRPQPSRAA
jgi:glycerol-3-phosphate dehydrogenase